MQQWADRLSYQSIPTAPGTESLNVAAAAAICLYEAFRRAPAGKLAGLLVYESGLLRLRDQKLERNLTKTLEDFAMADPEDSRDVESLNNNPTAEATAKAMASPAYKHALIVAMIAGLAVSAGTKFGLGIPGVAAAAIAVVVFLPVMAAVLLFNVAARPAGAKHLSRSAVWALNGFAMLALVVAGLTISSTFFGTPMNIRDHIIRSGAERPAIIGEMSAEVYGLFERGREAYKSNDPDESVRLFTQALIKDPDNYILLANRAVLYMTLERNTEAVADAVKAQDAFAKLGPQQLRREKAYKLILDNTLIASYNRNGQFAEVTRIYNTAKADIDDVADTITRIYFNFASAAVEEQKWQTARDAYYRVQAMARALSNYELEVKSYLNIAQTAYWLDADSVRKSISELDDGLRAVALYKFSADDKRLWTAQFHNAKGLALLRLRRTDLAAASLAQAKAEFDAGINGLKDQLLTSDEARRAYADLLGNLADVQLEQKDFLAAVRSYKGSMDIFIKVGDRKGISRQANGLGRAFLAPTSPVRDAQNAFASALVAIQLGSLKPAEQKDEDQRLSAAAGALLSQTEQAAVRQTLSDRAATAFGVEPAKFSLYLR